VSKHKCILIINGSDRGVVLLGNLGLCPPSRSLAHCHPQIKCMLSVNDGVETFFIERHCQDTGAKARDERRDLRSAQHHIRMQHSANDCVSKNQSMVVSQ